MQQSSFLVGYYYYDLWGRIKRGGGGVEFEALIWPCTYVELRREITRTDDRGFCRLLLVSIAVNDIMGCNEPALMAAAAAVAPLSLDPDIIVRGINENRVLSCFLCYRGMKWMSGWGGKKIINICA